jgi:hypothetical protein
MSNNLRNYPPIHEELSSNNMSVTAFMGGKFGYAVQFTIGGEYCGLAENQVRDLIMVLQKRVKSVKAYQSTQNNLDVTVNPEVKFMG